MIGGQSEKETIGRCRESIAKKDEVIMNCKYCGYSLEDGDESKYCPECGKPLYDEEANEDSIEMVSENEDTVEEPDEADMDDLNEESSDELEEDFDVYERPEDGQAEDDMITEPSLEVMNMDSQEEEPVNKTKGGAIVAAFAAILVIGCIVIVIAISSMKKKQDSAKDSNTQEANQTEQSDSDGTGDVISGEYIVDDGVIGDYSTYDQYVTNLGSYVGVEVNMTPEEVTDDAVEKEVSAKLQSATTTEEVTDRTDVQSGDIANIDYTGYMDGEAFEGGSATGTDLVIGSGTFIPGFEDGLIGATVGETVDVEVTFPEDYKQTDYAGKAATFKVTVNAIKKQVTPELNDDWVKNNSEYTTVDEYKASVRTQLEEAAAQKVVDTKASRALETIYNNSTIVGYPDGEIDDYVQYMNSYYEYYASMLGTTLDNLISSYFGMTNDEFTQQLNSIAEANIGTEMICYCIANKEGMTLTDDEYKEAAQKYATDNGFETVEEFESKYSKSQIYDRIIMDRVMEYVAENAVEVNE